MTLKKIDYSNTIIYKIVCNDLSVTDCYVGNTTQFRQRKSQHKKNCNNSNSKDYNIPLYKFIREHSGWENFSMIEIEKYPCTDGNEARARERYYFDLLNANLNKMRPLRTEDERKQYDKEYRQKENIKEYNKRYCKQYREEHINELKKYREENKDKNQERRSEKIKCSCGSVISRGYMSDHLKSFKHISRTQALFQSSDEIIHA